MTTTSPITNGTGTTPTIGTLTTARRRRVLQLATLSRRARRRATWIRVERAGELPPLAFVTTCIAAVTLSLALMGCAVIL